MLAASSWLLLLRHHRKMFPQPPSYCSFPSTHNRNMKTETILLAAFGCLAGVIGIAAIACVLPQGLVGKLESAVLPLADSPSPPFAARTSSKRG